MMNNAGLKESYPTQMLTGIYKISGEKKIRERKESSGPDVSNTVALIISATTKHFPSLENASENRFIAWEAECQSIIQKAMKNKG